MRDIATVVGLKVFSSREGREIGSVSQVIVDLASGVVDGLIVGTGPTERGIESKDIQVIGVDAVMVDTYKVARHLSELPGLLEKRRDPSLAPREVLTDTGKRIGVLGTIYIDPANKRVTRYEVSGGAWRDITEGVLSLAPMPGTVDGRDSIVVPTEAFLGQADAEGGIKGQLARLAAIARSQAKQAAESLEEGARGLKRGADVVKEKATEATARIREAGKEEAPAPEAAPPAESAPCETQEPAPDKPSDES